jgi:hypothetical protein
LNFSTFAKGLENLAFVFTGVIDLQKNPGFCRKIRPYEIENQIFLLDEPGQEIGRCISSGHNGYSGSGANFAHVFAAREVNSDHGI